MIGLACRGAQAQGKPLGVCGEAAARPALALVLAGLGVTSLSMPHHRIPAVRAALARHTLEQCRHLAALALAAASPEAARAVVLREADPLLGTLV
jgi:phosphotransferase system enzyme I (PtsI)